MLYKIIINKYFTIRSDNFLTHAHFYYLMRSSRDAISFDSLISQKGAELVHFLSTELTSTSTSASIRRAMAEPPSAAERALQKLEEQLTCGVCLEQYARPKLLQCFHVFCEKCLRPLARQSAQGLAVECPNCRQSSRLTQSGVPGLQGAFLMHHLFDIRDILRKVSAPTKAKCDKCKKRESSCYCRTCGFVCDKCKDFHSVSEWEEFSSHVIISLDQLTGDVINLVPPVQKSLQCSKHPDKQLDIYCETCEELICRDCIVRVHRDHEYDLVGDAFPKHKDVIVASLQPVEQQLATITAALEDLDARCGQINEQRQAVETEIQGSIQRLHRALEVREEDLISQLEQLSQEKLKSLASQREQLELVATRLKSCRDFVQETVRTGSQGEILAMKKPVTQQVREMSAEFKPESLAPKEQADMKFVHRETELTGEYQQFGMVSTHSVCPGKCQAIGLGTQVAMAGELATATLHARDEEGREWAEPVEVSCELVPSEGGGQVRGEVEGNGEGKYEISYSPQHRGRHQLHIRVEDTHISGSPFTVAVLTTTPTSSIRGLSGPWGVAVNERGQVIVAEYSGHCISIFSANGDKVASFGSSGSAPGQLCYPISVAITATGDILVSENNNHRIQLFSPEGRSLKCIGTTGSGHLQFQGPRGITIHPHSNKIYIADRNNHRIQILNPDLTFCSSFGGKGTGNGQFSYPEDISFDSTGHVFVSDNDNHRIQVFTENGVYIRQFGQKGGGEGELNSPVSIANSNDVVYIGEEGNHRISLFTRDGHFLMVIGAQGSGPGQFISPRGLTINKDGTLFISDLSNSCIQMF